MRHRPRVVTSKLPPLKTRPIPGSNDRLQMRRSETEPSIPPRGIGVFHEKKRPRKAGRPKDTSEEKAPSISNIIANHRMVVERCKSNNSIEDIAKNLEMFHKAITMRSRSIMSRIGDASSAELDVSLQMTEILQAILSDQRLLVEKASEICTNAQSNEIKMRNACSETQLLRAQVNDLAVDDWIEFGKISSSLMNIEGDIQELEPDRDLFEVELHTPLKARGSVAKNPKRKLILTKVQRLQDLISILKKRAANFEHNDALKKTLDKYSSLPNLLQTIGKLENENKKFRQRELRFQHDALLRRRDIDHCSSVFVASLISALQNELAVYRRIYTDIHKNIEHPLNELFKESSMKLEAHSGSAVNVDSAYELMMKRLQLHQEKGIPIRMEMNERCQNDMVVDEELLRSLLDNPRPGSAPRNAAVKLGISKTKLIDFDKRDKITVQNARFGVRSLRQRLETEYVSKTKPPEGQEGPETAEMKAQRIRNYREKWLVERQRNMPVENKMAAIFYVLGEAEKSMDIVEQKKQVENLKSLVGALAKQESQNAYTIAKSMTVIMAMITHCKALQKRVADVEKKEKAKHDNNIVIDSSKIAKPDSNWSRARFLLRKMARGIIAKQPSAIEEEEENEDECEPEKEGKGTFDSKKVEETFPSIDQKDLEKTDIHVHPEALGIDFSPGSEEMKAMEHHRRTMNRIWQRFVVEPEKTSLEDQDFLLTFCPQLAIVPDQMSELDARDIFNACLASSKKQSLEAAKLPELLLRFAVRSHHSPAANLSMPTTIDKIHAFMTSTDLHLQRLDHIDHQVRSRRHSRRSRSSRPAAALTASNLKHLQHGLKPNKSAGASRRSSIASNASIGNESNRSTLSRRSNGSRRPSIAGKRPSASVRRPSVSGRRPSVSARRPSVSGNRPAGSVGKGINVSRRPGSVAASGRRKSRAVRGSTIAVEKLPTYHLDQDIVDDDVLTQFDVVIDKIGIIFVFYASQRFQSSWTSLPSRCSIQKWGIHLLCRQFRILPYVLTNEEFEQIFQAVLKTVADEKEFARKEKEERAKQNHLRKKAEGGDNSSDNDDVSTDSEDSVSDVASKASTNVTKDEAADIDDGSSAYGISSSVDGTGDLSTRLSYPHFSHFLARVAFLVFSRSSDSQAADMRRRGSYNTSTSILQKRAIPYFIDFLDIKDTSEIELKMRMQRTKMI